MRRKYFFWYLLPTGHKKKNQTHSRVVDERLPRAGVGRELSRRDLLEALDDSLFLLLSRKKKVRRKKHRKNKIGFS